MIVAKTMGQWQVQRKPIKHIIYIHIYSIFDYYIHNIYYVFTNELLQIQSVCSNSSDSVGWGRVSGSRLKLWIQK